MMPKHSPSLAQLQSSVLEELHRFQVLRLPRNCPSRSQTTTKTISSTNKHQRVLNKSVGSRPRELKSTPSNKTKGVFAQNSLSGGVKVDVRYSKLPRGGQKLKKKGCKQDRVVQHTDSISLASTKCVQSSQNMVEPSCQHFKIKGFRQSRQSQYLAIIERQKQMITELQEIISSMSE